MKIDNINVIETRDSIKVFINGIAIYETNECALNFNELVKVLEDANCYGYWKTALYK